MQASLPVLWKTYLTLVLFRCLEARMHRFYFALIPMAFLATAVSFAQQADSQLPKKNPPITQTSRLLAAKTAYVKNAGGSSIPYNAIASAMEGWGRFTIVNSPENADIVLEVSSPGSGGGSVSVSSKTEASPRTGQPETSTSTTRELSTGPIRLTVIDAKSKSVMWTATEQPKSAMRKKAQEDNLVQAAEKLFSKFHDRVEPPPAQ